MEFDYQKALDYLLDIAYMRKISKVQLCEGICDPSNFSKICSGKRKITLSLLLQLTFKLNISFDDLKLHASFENPDEYVNIVHQLKQLRKRKDYHEIKMLHQKYQDKYATYNLEAKQLFTWMRGLTELFVYHNPLYSMDLLKKSILISTPSFSFELLNLEILNEQELDILFDFLVAYLGYEEKSRPISEYQLDFPTTACTTVIEELSQRSTNSDMTLFPKFCSMLAMIYVIVENEALLKHYAMKGVKYCQIHSELSLIPDLYMMLIYYERLFGSEERALQYFYESIYLYHLQNRQPIFYKNLDYFIREQQLNVDLEKVKQLTQTLSDSIEVSHQQDNLFR